MKENHHVTHLLWSRLWQYGNAMCAAATWQFMPLPKMRR
jgi:hypothetical protein